MEKGPEQPYGRSRPALGDPDCAAKLQYHLIFGAFSPPDWVRRSPQDIAVRTPKTWPASSGTWFALMVSVKRVKVMEAILEYISRLDGNTYRCLYKREYSERLGCYTLMMVPGSLRWIENGNQTDKTM